MTIIIQDFSFKGKHYNEVGFEMPNVNNIEDVPEDKIVPYVMESLKNLLED